MSAQLTFVELSSAQQALFTGQIVDGVTGSKVTHFDIALSMQLPGEDTFHTLDCHWVKHSTGHFAVVGVAAKVFPQTLPPDSNVTFQFSVSSPRFTPTTVSVAVPAVDLIADTTTAILANRSVELQGIDAPVAHQLIPLQPLPVGLQGITIEDNDANAPLAGVRIQVIEPEVSPAVFSDAQGRYRLASLPLAQTVVLQVDLAEESFTIQHTLDFNTPLNTRTISLNG